MTDKTIDNLIQELRKDEEYDKSFVVVEFAKTVGNILERMRKRHDLSQTQMAERLNMTPGRVWQLESGTLRNAPNLKNIALWARACEETVTLQASGEQLSARPEEQESTLDAVYCDLLAAIEEEKEEAKEEAKKEANLAAHY